MPEGCRDAMNSNELCNGGGGGLLLHVAAGKQSGGFRACTLTARAAKYNLLTDPPVRRLTSSDWLRMRLRTVASFSRY